MASPQPECFEVAVSASKGGKVTIIKFDLSADYHYSETRKYTIPADWDEKQINAFVDGVQEELDARADKRAQAESDDLIQQSQVFNSNGEYIG